jgi:hypothetical protein
VIKKRLHTEPYTESSAEESEDPESPLRYPPPFIDRLELVDPHERVGEDIEDEEKYIEKFHD